jgi:hypothetical protein
VVELSEPAALGLTLLVEVPVYTFALPALVGVPRRRAVALGVLVNLISHPLLWFVAYPGIVSATGSNLAALVVSETAVWLGEAVGLRLVVGGRFGDLLLVSLVANAASIWVGLLLQS